MPVELGVGFVNIVPSTRGFGSSLGAQLNGPALAAGKDAGTKAGRGFVAAIGAVAIGALVGRFLRSAFDEAEEAQVVGRQTAAVIKSTGGVAKVAAGDVERLAGALSKKAGIDDEVIQRGANMLLTFKNIRNEAGKGNDIFNQATKATVDLAAGYAAASGSQVDLKSATVQLGKALNDPIKGMQSLTRVGVQFTDQQKEQIKAAVESGDVQKAQKIILKEVQEQFGGSAAANATASAKMKVAFDNLKESIGTALIPIIQKLSDVLTPLFTFLANNQPVLFALAAVVGVALTAAFYTWTASLFAAGGALAILVSPVTAVVLAILAIVAAVVLVWQNWDAIWGFIRDNPVIAAIVAILFTPIAAFISLIGALKWVWENWDAIWSTIKDIVGAAVGFISGAIGAIGQVLGSIIGALNFLRDIWNAVFSALGGIAAGAAGAVVGALGPIIDTLRGIVNLAQDVANAISDIAGFGDSFTARDFLANHPEIKARASGGPIGQGTFLVGERGPELLTFGPGTSGFVTPQMPGGGGLFDGATVNIGDTNVIPDLDYFARTRMAGV